MSKAMRRLTKPRTLLLSTVVILAVSAASALAATIVGPPTGNWTLIGTTGNDTISGANGNYTVLGLGGNDTIAVGNGNNYIEADGKCPPGDQDTVTPSPGNAVYCSLDQIGSKHTDTIAAGNGNNIIIGGGYSNTISAGNGENAIYAGGSNSNTVSSGNGPNLIVGGSGPNTISVGNANVNCGGSSQPPCVDLVYAGGGPDTIKVGSGTSLIYAQNGKVDHITCAPGNNATVYADRNDVVVGCKRVITNSAPSAQAAAPAPGTPLRASVDRRAKKAAGKRPKHNKSHAKKRPAHRR